MARSWPNLAWAVLPDFSAQRAAWALPIEEGSWKGGIPRKLVESTAGLRYARAIGAGTGAPERIVFAGESTEEHLWSLALDSNTGKVKGGPTPLPHSGGRQTMPALDAAGRFLAFTRVSPGRQEVRMLDVASGKETTLVAGLIAGWIPHRL